jgi:hypothetical protein
MFLTNRAAWSFLVCSCSYVFAPLYCAVIIKIKSCHLWQNLNKLGYATNDSFFPLSDARRLTRLIKISVVYSVFSLEIRVNLLSSQNISFTFRYVKDKLAELILMIMFILTIPE